MWPAWTRVFLPSLPLGWGDERPWERGWSTLLIGPVIVLNHAMRRHIHFVKQKKAFRQNRPHSPRNMLFTLMLAVSADFVKHKEKFAWKLSLIPRRMRSLPLRSPFLLISSRKGEHWRGEINFLMSMANIFLLLIQFNSKLVKMFTGAIK